jgi:hypothetical protein
VGDNWERFLVQSRKLAGETMSKIEADAFVTALLEPFHNSRMDLKETRGYKRIMDLFSGQAIGADIPGVAGTRWAMLNAVTELVDHERGRSARIRALNRHGLALVQCLKIRRLELLSA